MSTKIYYQDLELDWNSPLGSGYIATVYLAKHKVTGEPYAVKVVDMTKVNNLERIALKREIEIHQSLDHPNIVKMFSSQEKDTKLYLVLEYLPKGTLFQHMQNGFQNEEIKDIFTQIVNAVNYIHQKGYIHRDIKPENIIQAQNGQYKLCDFGFSAEFGKQKKRVTICGTDDYFPPEILQGDEQTEKVDIWCLGILLYELAHGRTPFKGELFARKQTVSGDVLIKPSMENLLNKIVKKCLKRNPIHRPNAEKILQMLNDKQNKQGNNMNSISNNNQGRLQNQFQPHEMQNAFKKINGNNKKNMGFERISINKDNSIKNQNQVYERKERKSMEIVHKLQPNNTYKTHVTTLNGGFSKNPQVISYYVDYKKNTNQKNNGFELPLKQNKYPIQKAKTYEPQFQQQEQRSFSPAPIKSYPLNNTYSFPVNRVQVNQPYQQQTSNKSKKIIRLTNDFNNKNQMRYQQNSGGYTQYRKMSKSQDIYRHYKQFQFLKI